MGIDVGKKVPILRKIYESGHNLVITIPVDVVKALDLKKGDQVKGELEKVE